MTAEIAIRAPGEAIAPRAGEDRATRWWNSAWLAIPLLLAIVLGSRALSITHDEERNVDESQMMAQALRAGLDPVPWRGIDNTTTGPVNSWLLLLAHELGMPLTYSCVHALAAAILAAICVLTYATLRQMASGTAALLGATACALCMALAQSYEFTHFDSELVPALLTAGVLLACAWRSRCAHRRALLEVLAAVGIGLLPWCKLQSIFGAAALAGWLGWQILRESAWESAERRTPGRRFFAFGCAGLLPSVLILGTVTLAGAWPDFWLGYIQGSLSYAANSHWTDLLVRARKLFFEEQISVFLQGLAAFGALWLALGVPGWKTAPAAARQLLVGVALLAAADFLAVVKPPSFFPHYQVFLIQPIGLLAGCILAVWETSGPAFRHGKIALPAFVLGLLGLQLSSLPAAQAEIDFQAVRSGVEKARPPASRQIVSGIEALAPEVKSMAVWGWMPSLFVELSIPPATRHAVMHFVIDPGPARERARETFLADLRREKPDLIVDAIAEGCFRWTWDYSQGIASFPALQAYVQSDYVLAGEIDLGASGHPVRCYLSRSYLAAHGKPISP